MINAVTGPIQKLLSRASLEWLLGNSEDKPVSTRDILSLPAIWNGVSRISGHISQLPVGVYESIYDENGEKIGGKKSRSHNAYWLTMRRPNMYQTPVIFREQLSKDSLLEGNGRAAIVRSGNRIMELIPLSPAVTATGMIYGDKMHITRPEEHDRLRLFFGNENDKNGIILLEDKDVLHIPGLSSNGVSGIALKDIGRRNLGMAIASEKRLQTQMEKGFSGSLILEIPNGILRSAEDAEEFLEQFEKRHNSPEKAGKVAALREGIKANLLASNNKDTEMNDLRKFSRQDQALWLGLEQILGDDSSVSYNSLEQKLLAYLMNTLNRWLKRWEEELEYKLLSKRDFESEKYYIRFTTAALLKSDFKSTVESLALAITSTIMSPNEARAKLDYNPREGGDVYSNPAITPGDSNSQTADDDTPDETPTNRESLATIEMLKNLTSVEADRAVQAAERGRNFCNWLDGFYKNWETKLADKIESIGGDRNLATLHCNESKQRLLHCASNATKETLVAVVSECVANWPARAIALAEEMELTNV